MRLTGACDVGGTDCQMDGSQRVGEAVGEGEGVSWGHSVSSRVPLKTSL